MSSAVWRTSLKVVWSKVMLAIPDFTLAGSWRLHKAITTAGQQGHWNFGLCLQMSLTNPLAN